jgi:hypothetical protein
MTLPMRKSSLSSGANGGQSHGSWKLVFARPIAEPPCAHTRSTRITLKLFRRDARG